MSRQLKTILHLENTLKLTNKMRLRIISLIIVVATSGCWATIPIPYLQFGVRQPQQYFYQPPQRQFPPQPFFPNFEPFRYPQIYGQPQVYGPPQAFAPPQPFAHAQPHPFNFYIPNNVQAVPRDVFPPVYAGYDDPALHYYQRMAVLFGTHRRQPLLERPLVRDIVADCDTIVSQKAELENIQKKMETQAMAQEVRRTSADSGTKIVDEKSPVQEQKIDVEVATKSPSSGDKIARIIPGILLETPVEEVVTKSPNPGEQTTASNSAAPLETFSGEGVFQTRLLGVWKNLPSTDSTNSQDARPAENSNNAVDAEKQKSPEIAATKESVPEVTKMESTEIKTELTKEAEPQEVQDVIVVPTLTKESDAIPPNEGTAEESTTMLSNS